MTGWLLVLAWMAGIASLLLVVDMIVTDLSSRRAERIAARRSNLTPPEHSRSRG